ncbi:hypothetical protein TRFO_06229 [Tritrichomonas foetus]|uniref:SH3 domain-containing protein n=1 Tax=Tritrichomonas foetus TaxID=1144522 RepID=A0A1J4K4Y7_9EUKA|nr:hypothetical protein TRFO_06229 [Tritrichomonas foetus]|eukprot:OHT04780.1 hypothetical protein TRFO_06229 [Tritrichomonas foetus]
MSERGKSDFNFNAASEEYNAIDTLFIKMNEIGQQFGQSASKFTQIKIPLNPEDTIPGLPGTLMDVTTALFNMFSKSQMVFQTYTTNVVTGPLMNLRVIKSERESDKKMIDGTVHTSESFDKHLLQRMITQQRALMDSINKLNDYADKNPTCKTTPTNSQRSKVTSLWQNYIQNLGKFLAERQSLKISASDLERKLSSKKSFLETSEADRRKAFYTTVMCNLSETIGQISTEISKVRTEFENSLKLLNFNSDFKTFSTCHKLNFYDFPRPKFERFKFSSQFTQPDQFYIPRFKLDYFPLYAGVALGDFTPESPNEIPLVKGKRVYLMEEVTHNWVLAMNPSWCQIGFIPSTYVNVVGTQLAYLRKDVAKKSPKLALSNMRLVAITSVDDQPKKTYTCEDEDGESITICEDEGLILLL